LCTILYFLKLAIENRMRNFCLLFFGLLILTLSTHPSLHAQKKKQPKQPKKRTTTVYNYLSKTKSPEEILAIPNKMERLFYMFCGEFHNKAQADTTKIPFLKAIQYLIVIPIWQEERKGEYWIYGGRIRPDESQKVFGQNIIRMTSEKDASDNVLYKLTFYTLPKELEETYVEEWKKEKPFAELKPRDLEHSEGCVSYIVASETQANEYEFVHMQDAICYRKMSEQLYYYTFNGSLKLKEQHFYTEFFDADKKRVFGYSRPQGLWFVRQDKNKPMFPAALPVKK
jgi:hypothetical protein